MALGTNGCRQVLPAGSLPHGSDAPPPHLRLAPGPSFHGASLLEEQAAALARNVELTTEAAVDAVVIAGDLYDRAIPPAEAVQLFNDTLARLRESGAAVVAIAGNHDSHVQVSIYEPVLVSPRRGGSPVAIYPLPYLEPAVDGRALASSAEAGAPAVPDRLRHEDVARLALDRIRLDLRERIRCGIDVLAGDKGSRVVVEALEMV